MLSDVQHIAEIDGDPHPGKVLESSTLTLVKPPALKYKLHVPAKGCGISSLQYEAVARICQKHEEYLQNGSRAGFLLGMLLGD